MYGQLSNHWNLFASPLPIIFQGNNLKHLKRQEVMTVIISHTNYHYFETKIIYALVM